MDELTRREQDLIEQMGVLKALREVESILLTALVVRLGGAVTVNGDEILHTIQTYHLHMIGESTSYTKESKISLTARLK